MTLYTVTTLEGLSLARSETRTPGIFTTVEKAREVVENNVGNIHEDGYYPWAIIEEVQTDRLYPYGGSVRIWFRWDNEVGRYVEVPPPEGMIGRAVGWGIG